MAGSIKAAAVPSNRISHCSGILRLSTHMPVSKAPTAKPMEGPPPTIAAETAELLAYRAGIDSIIHAITAEAVSPDANALQQAGNIKCRKTLEVAEQHKHRQHQKRGESSHRPSTETGR